MKLPKITTNIQVRFSDTDALGHISSASYIQYMEVGRTDFFYELARASEVPHTAVVNINVDYVNETLFGNTVKVTTWCSRVGNKSMTIANEVHADDKLAIKGSVTVVGFDLESRQSCKLPQQWEPSKHQ
jgi:acyl-CoA thioester hydrolase